MRTRPGKLKRLKSQLQESPLPSQTIPEMYGEILQPSLLTRLEPPIPSLMDRLATQQPLLQRMDHPEELNFESQVLLQRMRSETNLSNVSQLVETANSQPSERFRKSVKYSNHAQSQRIRENSPLVPTSKKSTPYRRSLLHRLKSPSLLQAAKRSIHEIADDDNEQFKSQ